MTSTIFPTPRIVRDDDGEQGFILRSETPLNDYPERVLEYLPVWAKKAPDRPFISQRDANGEWESITYGEIYSRARALGQFLLAHGCNAARPVVVLTPNSIASATVIVAAIYAGIPVVPVSAAYSTIPEAFNRLEYCLDLVTPGAIFVESGAQYQKVVARLNLDYGMCIAGTHACDGMLELESLVETDPGNIDEVFAATGLNTVVKILFTSGSTGVPKGVINTNRMMSANQQQLVQVYPFLEDEPPVVLDWLPWSHTFGGNEVFTMTLRHGGQLYIDAGKPVASGFDTTLANLRDVAPTIYFNVPLGYDLLATALEQDDALNQQFFSRLNMLFFSASALPQSIRDRLDKLAQKAGRDSVALTTGWGATETAPLATAVHYDSVRTDNIGVPASGCEIRFASSGGRYELRVRGPQVTPGYWRNSDKTAEAFDDKGFYKTGDAAYLMDESNPSAGIIFDGRVSEDFKLLSGTWVPVGKLRVSLVNVLLPLAQDVIVLGQDWETVCILVFPNKAECQALTGKAVEDNGDGLVTDSTLADEITKRLESYNEEHTASSMRVHRFGVLAEAPSIKDHEITEKGSINQRGVIARRDAQVQLLRSGAGGIVDGIVTLGGSSITTVARTTKSSSQEETV